jgi:hypothetical protein
VDKQDAVEEVVEDANVRQHTLETLAAAWEPGGPYDGADDGYEYDESLARDEVFGERNYIDDNRWDH